LFKYYLVVQWFKVGGEERPPIVQNMAGITEELGDPAIQGTTGR